MKVPNFFQRFLAQFIDAFYMFCEVDFADIGSLSSWKDHCKTMFSGLINDCQSNSDVIKIVGEFAADFSKSCLFKVILDEDVDMTFKKSNCWLVLSIWKMGVLVFPQCLLLSVIHLSTWFEVENMIEMIISELSEVLRMVR